MSFVLVKTKLIPPQPRSDFVSRPRLVRRIANPGHARVTLITAPAGYGKTTLLAEWCAAHRQSRVPGQERIAWVALDDADNDPALFWRYVAAALGLAGDFAGTPAVDGLLNVLAGARKDVTLLLDDLHLIRSKRILSDLARLIDYAPARLGIVLASRTPPALPLARWRARGQLSELQAQHLAFTPGEARAFLQTTMQLAPDAETVIRLEKMTEGWAAGLQLAALSLGTTGARGTADMGRKDIFEYLAAEVLARQAKTRQRFLLETSILERVTPELADAVTGRSDSGRILRGLVASNLFITPLGAERTWYRYHPLFADFLRDRLGERNPAREKELHQRAAHWFARQGLASEAIAHALAAQDYTHASVWIDAACDAAMQYGQLATILKWLDALPKTVTASNPALSLWYGWATCLEQRFDEMEAHLRNAEKRAAPSAKEKPGSEREAVLVRGKCAAVRAQAANLQQDDGNALKWSKRALDLLPAQIRNERTIVWLNRARAFERAGQPGHAERAYAKAEESSAGAAHPFIHLGVLVAKAEWLARRGERTGAREQLRRALAFARVNKIESLAAPARRLLDELGAHPLPRATLSKREREILEWMTRGESNPEIARQLGIGVGTVNWHTKNIYKKLGARNRTEAALAGKAILPER